MTGAVRGARYLEFERAPLDAALLLQTLLLRDPHPSLEAPLLRWPGLHHEAVAYLKRRGVETSGDQSTRARTNATPAAGRTRWARCGRRAGRACVFSRWLHDCYMTVTWRAWVSSR